CVFDAARHDPPKAAAALNKLGRKLGWPTLSATNPANDLYTVISQFGPAKLLVTKVSANAQVLDYVASMLLPDVPDEITRTRAMDCLLRLCNFARDVNTEKVFLPARLHLFFRG